MRAVNLIPADQRRSGGTIAGRSGGAAYVVIGLLVVLAGLTALYATARHEVASKEAEATRLSAEARQAEQAANALAPYSRFVTLREERMTDVKQLAGTRFDWAHVMHELGRVLPAGSVALSSVQGTIGAAAETAPTTTSSTESSASGTTSATAVGGSVTSSTPAGSAPVLTIAGCASSQAEVAQTMDRLRLMDGVSEVSLQSSQSSGSSAASGGGGGSCGKGASFSLSVDFEGLPAPQTSTTPSTATTSSAAPSSSGSSATGSPAGSGAGSAAESGSGATGESKSGQVLR